MKRNALSIAVAVALYVPMNPAMDRYQAFVQYQDMVESFRTPFTLPPRKGVLPQ